jgi:hypothetical protein
MTRLASHHELFTLFTTGNTNALNLTILSIIRNIVVGTWGNVMPIALQLSSKNYWRQFHKAQNSHIARHRLDPVSLTPQHWGVHGGYVTTVP